MSLKLMYITNQPEVARIAEKNGVEYIFVDMEYIGKAARQGGMDTVQNHHTIEDIKVIRQCLTTSRLLVRINPIHEASDEYTSTEEEIEATIDAGADTIMLPYFKTVAEVERFLKCVNGRTKVMLLLETKQAVEVMDEIMALPGVDEIHLGLNDLSISYGQKFLFQPLVDGKVEMICRRLQSANKFFGFGGIASLSRGMVPAELIIKEHYRLGSHMAILSRSFCNLNKIQDITAIDEIFYHGIREIRELEKECAGHMKYFSDNQKELSHAVGEVLKVIKK